MKLLNYTDILTLPVAICQCPGSQLWAESILTTHRVCICHLAYSLRLIGDSRSILVAFLDEQERQNIWVPAGVPGSTQSANKCQVFCTFGFLVGGFTV